jgi:hypothetical protein
VALGKEFGGNGAANGAGRTGQENAHLSAPLRHRPILTRNADGEQEAAKAGQSDLDKASVLRRYCDCGAFWRSDPARQRLAEASGGVRTVRQTGLKRIRAPEGAP